MRLPDPGEARGVDVVPSVRWVPRVRQRLVFDGGMLDIVGFDTAEPPQVMADFAERL